MADDTSPQAPDVGTLFTYQGSAFRVNGWLRRRPEPDLPPEGDPMREFMVEFTRAHPRAGHGPDACALAFCTRAEAEYVSGVGVCGCIARLADIEVTGTVAWSEAAISDSRRTAERLAGTAVF